MGKNKKTLGELKKDGLKDIKQDDMTKLVGGKSFGVIRFCRGNLPQ